MKTYSIEYTFVNEVLAKSPKEAYKKAVKQFREAVEAGVIDPQVKVEEKDRHDARIHYYGPKD